MNLTPEFVSSLLQDLYEAPANGASWLRFVKCLSEFCECERCWLVVSRSRLRAAKTEVGLVQLLAPKNLLGTETVPGMDVGFVRAERLGDIGGLAEGFVLQSTHPHGEFSEGAMRLMRALKPHLERVFRSMDGRRSAANLTPAFGWLPRLFDLAVVSVDDRGAVLEISDAARALLRQGGLLMTGRDLSACVPAEQATLRRLLGLGGARGAESIGQVSAGAAGAPLHFAGAGQFSRRAPLPALTAVAATLGPGAPRLLFLCDPQGAPSSRASLLRVLYRLSPTEGRLVDELASGSRLKDAANKLRLTENTARFHLKEVFRKVGVNSQIDLLRYVLALPKVGDGAAEPMAPTACGVIPITDGRLLGGRRSVWPQGQAERLAQ